jgi:hypothetical protein
MGIYTKVPDPAGDKWVEIGGGLPGIGGWSTITEVTGTYTKHSYGDWVAYEFTDDGTLTAGGGLVDALIVGGGAAASASFSGGAGGVMHGVQDFTAATHNVLVGTTPTDGTNTDGSRSAVGDDSIGGGLARMVCPNGFQDFESSGYGAGAGSTGDAPDRDTGGPGFLSSITGTPLEYAQGGGKYRSDPDFAALPPGSGSDRQNNSDVFQYRGTDGVVIVRVPAANAQNVAETFHGWDNYASVENGVVVETQKLPDNQPRTLSNEWLDAPAEVSVGWIYDGSEFVPPAPPSNKDLIAELEAQVEELRKA